MDDCFRPKAAFHERQISARSGQFRRLSSTCLKLEGVYRSRGDSYFYNAS